MNYELTLGPGAIRPINAQGNFFAVVSSALDVFIRMPGTEFSVYGQGDSLTLPPGELFPRLEVRNPSATATLIVTIYAGGGRYEQRRQAVMEPRTEFDAWDGTQLAAATGQLFDGVPVDRRMRRKAVQVTNEDANLRLQIRDEAGHVGQVVFPEQSTILPISEAVEVFNPNGAAVACRIAEIWWIA